MNKRKLFLASILSIILLVTSAVFPAFQKPVMAYTNSNYFSDIKVELLNIAGSTLTAKLTGDYQLNGQALPSGSVLNINIVNNQININGISYASVSLVPNVSTNLIALSNGTKTYNYNGSFTFIVSNSIIYPINSLPMEDYIKGVVGYEMSNSFPLEALKAQAVAARTYALCHKGACAAKGYDFDDTTNYQVYYGYSATFVNVNKSVDMTKGQVLTYNGAIIDAVFSDSDGGYTEDIKNVWGSSAPYLISKADVLNGQVIDNGSWSYGNKTFSNAQVDSTLKSKGYLLATDTFVKLDLTSITRYVSKRVSKVNVIYKDQYGVVKTLSITGAKCRSFLGLQSAMWNVSYSSKLGTYTFSGKGYGHGVGMSQTGAKQRATLGQTYDNILKFYYNGIVICSLV